MNRHPDVHALLERTSLKQFVIIGLTGIMIIFALIAMLTSFEMKYRFASSTVNQWLTHFTSESFMYVIGMENRYFTSVLPEESKPPTFSSIAFEFATSIKPGDIRSLLGRELPGFALYDADIYVAGEGTDYTNLPIESAPPMEVLLEERQASIEKLENISGDQENITPPALSTGDKNVVFIYHAHSSESYLPHLEGVDDPDSAFHPEVNVTMVGKRLAEEMQKRGIGATADETDMVVELNEKGLQYANSYQVAREVVQTAMADDRNLNFFFDIHRDAQRREITTTTIDGETYSRLFFVVGKAHKNYEQNLRFANTLHEMINEAYPGLSRGVITKDDSQGNGIYNQDLSSNAVLLEFGGVDNSMEENFRTAEALADVFSAYYWQAEKVSNEK